MYSPEIKPELVKMLYQLKLKTGKKMTQLVCEAVTMYLKSHELKIQPKETELNEKEGERVS